MRTDLPPPRHHAPSSTLQVPHARWWRAAAAILATAVLLLALVWGLLALWYGLAGHVARWPALLCWGVTGLAACWLLPWGGRTRWRSISLGAYGLGVLAMAIWWAGLAPSHERHWADDVARLLQVRPDADGRHVHLHNVRDFHWRSETDYDVHWRQASYDLDTLVSADLVLSYWMGPHVAHTLVSFGFSDGRQLVLSLEIRKERHERFSALAGFFRQFEAVLVAAEEADILAVRTNIRGEDVHLYRLALDPPQLRTLLLGYLEDARALEAQPAFYNTLTSNCTTIIYRLARRIAPGLPLDWRLLLTGHAAAYAFDHGALVPGYPYAQLREAGRITARARAWQGARADFPQAIRVDLPVVAP